MIIIITMLISLFCIVILFNFRFPELEIFERRELTFILPCHCPVVFTIFVGHSRAGLQGWFTGQETSPLPGRASIPDIHDQWLAQQTGKKHRPVYCVLFRLCLQDCRQASYYGGLETSQEYESRILCFFATHQLRLRMTLKTFDVKIQIGLPTAIPSVRCCQQATII